MNKQICDDCGRKIQDAEKKYLVGGLNFPDTTEFYLCSRCIVRLLENLKG